MARVLVVDDEKSIRIVLREFLKKEGHEVYVAEDVSRAFELLEKNHFDVVVTDIIMPRITGVDLLKKIHEKWSDIQVIMITGEPNVNTAVEAVRSGAFDYLSKPVSRDAIIKVVSNAARIKTLCDEKKLLEVENRKYREHLEDLVGARTHELTSLNEELKVEIHERKQAEEKIGKQLKEKELLLREVHHRVKNNMQIIQSLLTLQTRKIDDDTVRRLLSDAGNRIRSMSLIHEKLYRSKDFGKIDFSEYLVSLASNLYLSHNVSMNRIGLRMDCANIDLDINTAIPGGLIINELLTNCLKHAFPGNRNGEISIIFRSDGEDGYELIFGDNGVGIPGDFDIGNTESLGLHLVNILVEDQLLGKLTMDVTNGTRFHIGFGAVDK